MRQNETQEKARLKIEMKLLQSLVQMEPFFFSYSAHTKGENIICEELLRGIGC